MTFMDPHFAEAGRDDPPEPEPALRRFQHAYFHPGPQDCRDYAQCHERAYGEDIRDYGGEA